MRGRRPTPAVVKEFRGNPGKRRVPANEAEPPAGPVEKPAVLSRGAGVVWDQLAPLAIEMGVLSRADVCAFKVLCELQATMDLIASQKDAAALTDMPALHRLERQTAIVIRPYYGMFGLTAADRSRIAVPTKPTAAPSKWTGILP